ncbi:acyltransferase (plasmid) [Xanthomonas campestris pv. campestris]|uniref:acyltransferase family protein n=1 Tax=Xanthomonas campestris TaxID=339 RepID=UPI002367BEE6|nr:acyltransferase [Xanthomonas campestris]MEB1409556.1 acyltransferase [Xanthomonas campestris pv. campestris]MEB1509465.1 acyltransferase [Xanthomonas campestris pv. campestris]MEB1763568.1 acyltransferase [Xanthomonas campestris pv. campestris]MEB1872763.1 acyltransferase [Xanthomonas campestris pv. campestris]MEB1909858.1 acyltransferase [Xanthomonas campestris pv. campestris]
MEVSKPRPLQSLQALRALAAAAVVVYHLINAEVVYGGGIQILGGLAHLGFAGVDMFFAISGFIMVMVSSGKFGDQRGALDFLAKRFIRIFPLYWLCTGAIALVLSVRPGLLDPALLDRSLIRSLFLLPQEGGPLLVVGWTLTFELFFYLMTAMALAFGSERNIPFMLCGWAVALALLQWVPVQGPWPQLVTSPLAFEFIAGAAAAILWKSLSPRQGVVALCAAVALALLAAWTLLNRSDFGQTHGVRTLAFAIPCALTLAAAARLELAGWWPVSRWAAALGDASYSLYLTHVFVLSLSGRLWIAVAPTGTITMNALFLASSFIACCVVALLTYRFVERPLLDLGNRWLAHIRLGAQAGSLPR